MSMDNVAPSQTPVPPSSTYNSNAADDSDDDNDLVTDFLNSNCNNGTVAATPTTTNYPLNAKVNNEGNKFTNTATTSTPIPTTMPVPPRVTVESQHYCIPVINAPTTTTTTQNNNNSNSNNNNSMIPIINVTPHSPASVSKYNNIFEDTLSQLQNIRESVVQMKNSSVQLQEGLGGNYGLLSAAILSASLPDLSAAANGGNVAAGCTATGAPQYIMWPTAPTQPLLLSADRRKSWTAIDELSGGAAGDCTNKSVSLSSLDSEETETIRVTEQRRRSARNSTGGISTHSLNEAELARDFERIAAKRSLANEIISRIPLQKSISTSSIIAKDDIKAAIARHLTDSEDENQSLLRAHAKIEVYADNVEKRRKRGSLFFRKKNKDKTKMSKTIGGQISACDVCGAPISVTQLKEHQLECTGGIGINGKQHKKLLLQGVAGQQKLAAQLSGIAAKNIGQDYYDATDGVQSFASAASAGIGHYNDDNTPLIRAEFLNDAPVDAQDLGADPALGIALKEHDSWTPGIPKELLKTMQEIQIKRQEHIYEFIMTEKHHCQTLLVMQKVIVESLERHFPTLNIAGMFPRLTELTELHTDFLRRLRQKQREQMVVDSIADILLEFFALEQAQHLRLAYGEFCANHRSALEQFKQCLTEPSFAEWYKHCLANPLLKKKGIPECILFVTQRLTKYPLLIEPLLKSARDNKLETDKLQHALSLVKSLLVDVDACVAEKELRERQQDIYNRVDAKSFAIYKNKPFRKCDIGIASRRRLKFEGLATLMQGRAKMQLVLVVVLTDCLCLLCENSAHNKYTFFTPESKAGVVPLQKLLIREKAGTESRGIYIISSNPDFPEMYELKVQTPKDKNTWIQSIRQAVLECPATDVLEAEDLTAEEKLRIGVNKRETIEKMRQKDIEQALLLEEKLMLQLNLLKEQLATQFSENDANNSNGALGAANFLAACNASGGIGASYKDLVGVETDTSALWKRVLHTVQDISQLAATVYTAATGLPVSRAVSSVGEKQSENYASPTLPKRAETFAGFDEKRAKHAVGGSAFPCREAAKLATFQVLTPRLQELEEKRELKTSQSNNSSAATTTTTLLPEISVASNMPLDAASVKAHNYAVLQVSHHLHTLLCIISQQMTTIQNLQLQLALYRENPRAVYTHNDQLEELRNLQDKLQEEKTAWLRQKEQQEQELAETHAAQLKLQAEIKAEQEDIKQQREQLYRKMELLSSQGLLLSPSTPLPIATNTLITNTTTTADVHDAVGVGATAIYDDLQHSSSNSSTTTNQISSSTVERRKDKWRTASTISKTPPVNLLSANNAPKINQTSVKQKLPMKLSSLSSTAKIDKSASFNANSANHHASTSGASGVTQLFPLKLADKRTTISSNVSNSNSSNSSSHSAAPLVIQHSRTGSSPAVIQHPTTTSTISTPTPATTVSIVRADSSSGAYQPQRLHCTSTTTPTSSRSIIAQLSKCSIPNQLATTNNKQQQQQHGRHSNNGIAPHAKPEEEEIYF